ncbi:MAG: lamin tail domain-containing protein, partial [Candidatus Marinimicrobia bacterium]|nr:lamin tail domain-containing protein [Candidatus Neomarinimicrobiota bacterium]
MKKISLAVLALNFIFSQVVINEIHYNPATSQGNDADYEFLELYNVGTSAVDLTGWTVGATDTNPASLDGVVIDGDNFVVIAYNGSFYSGLTVPVIDNGGYFGLGNSGKNLQLINNTGAVVDELTYDDGAPWPTDPDGYGPSLELIDPLTDNSLAGSWASSLDVGGTPGAQNSVYIAPGDNYPPVANAGSDFTAGSGETVYLDGSASYDPNGMIVYYIWEQTAGTTVTLIDSESDMASFVAPASGSLTFQLTVYDDEAAFDTDDVTITICSSGVVSIADARGLGIDQCVTIQAVVTSPSFQGSVQSEYTIQDDTAGIILFAPEINLGLMVGDEVLVSGTTDEYNGKFEIIVEDPSQVTFLGVTDLPVPQIVTVSDLSTNGEAWESELVTIENVFLSSGIWPPDGTSANLIITDNGTSTLTMRIDSDTEIDGSPEPGWPVNVTGVGGQYDSTVPYDSGYQLLPRFNSDFEETGGNQYPIADGGDDQIAAPGSLVTMDASGSSDPDGTIVGYIWEQTLGENVVLSDYEEPVVTFTAPSSEGVLGFSLTAIDNMGAMATDDVSIIISGGGTSIYDVQYTTDPGGGTDCYPSPYANSDYVIVSGVVTGVTWGTYHNFFIQDPNGTEWSGVYIFDGAIDPQVGDELVLAALVTEYYGFTELTDVAGFATLSTGNTIQPLEVTTGELGAGCSLEGESLEGVLVKVSNVVVTEEVISYGEWYVDDGTGPCQIDDNLFEGDPYSATLGEEIGYIIGVVDYSYDQYAILPRSMNDLDVQVETMSIYDIQYTINPGDGTYPSLLDGQAVTINGIVTAANFYSSGNANRFFMTDTEG